MIVETVRLSEKARNQLIQIKRKTKVEQWNVICRWALLLSLKEENPPPIENLKTDSPIEMAWKTFAGELSAPIVGMVRAKYVDARVEYSDIEIEEFFKLHLHRGVSFLANATKDNISSLLSLTKNAEKSS